MNVEQKRKNEQDMLQLMIQVYCRGNHGSRKDICQKCQELLAYALLRTEKCPFMEEKTFCSACKVHCYAPEKREQIRLVMKYAGPRMMLYHPGAAVRHLMVTISQKRKQKKEEKG